MKNNAVVEQVKQVIKQHFEEADCGIFGCRNLCGDDMSNLYDNGDVQVDICYQYAYFEVLGLNGEEYTEVMEYYYALLDEAE